MNLLYIFTDEQRLDTLACYNNHQIHMPELNRLAKQSVVFEEPYCTQPVCTPSRGSLMTGLLPHTHGATNNNVLLPEDRKCLPELLPQEVRQRMKTAYIGKWHLGDEVFAQHGYDEWVSIEDAYIAHYREGRDRKARSSYHRYLDDLGFSAGPGDIYDRHFAARLAEPYTKAHFVGTETARFIRDNQNDAWLCTVNFLEPHMPFYGPYDSFYRPDEVPLPENFDAIPGEEQPGYLREIYERYQREGMEWRDLTSEAGWRDVIARYWGLNQMVDAQIGRILRSLESTGQMDDTLIVFTSDHGDQMGSHRLLAKSVMYQESTQVPLLVKLPGQTTQGRISGPVSHIDLVPTLLEALGGTECAQDQELQGRSLYNVCKEAARGTSVSSVGEASPCVVEWNVGKQECQTRIRTLITPEGERYSHQEDGEHEFYDLTSDPEERQNLARSPEKQKRIGQLQTELAAWQQATHDEPLENLALVSYS